MPETPREQLAKLVAKGAAAHRRGAIAVAIAAFKEAIALDDAADRAHSGIAAAYFDADQNALALRHALRALELNARIGQALYFWGNVHQAQGSGDKARDAYERYLKIEPNGRYAGDVKLILETM